MMNQMPPMHGMHKKRLADRAKCSGLILCRAMRASHMAAACAFVVVVVSHPPTATQALYS